MRARFVLFASWILLCLAAPVLAQLDCPTLVEGGISTLAANCASLEANTVCYGSDSVETSFAVDATSANFDSPGDRAFLSQFLSIHTVPANLEKQLWGIVALRANVPLDTSENEATILLMGDATLRFSRADDTQLFQFTSAFDGSPCVETPSTLAIQGAANTQLFVNDAAIRFVVDGVIALQQVSANSLILIVESGQIEVSDDGGEPDQSAQAGQTLAAITENTGNIILWSAAREISDEESQLAGIVVEALFRMSSAVVSVPEPTQAPETVEQPIATQIPPIEPTVAPTELPVEEPTLPCGNDVIHVVQRGENIYRISVRYGTTVDAIAAANNLANPRLIHSGLQLRIPCANGVVSAPPVSAPPIAPPIVNVPTCAGGSTTYVVQTGDSLYGIALRFGTTTEAIAAANGITDINAISIGQTLVIPCAGVAVPVDCTPFITAGLPCP